MKRIDKIISEQTNYTRKEIKKMISKKLLYVNDILVKNSDEKYDEENDVIRIGNEIVKVRKNIYLILNKPKGYISTTNEKEKSILELVEDKYNKKGLFPVGRLDKDTTGLIIITNDRRILT